MRDVHWKYAFWHWVRKHHWPEWVELGNLLACVRCVKGGTRSRVFHLHAVPLPLH